MNVRGAADRERATASDPALGEPDLEQDELELEPPNSLLAHMLEDATFDVTDLLGDWWGDRGGPLELFFGDGFGAQAATDVPESAGPAGAAGPAAEPAARAGEGPDGSPAPGPSDDETPAARRAPDAEDGQPAAPATDVPAAADDAVATAAPQDAAPAADAGGTVPAGGEEIQARVGSALGAIPHPRGPSPARARAELDAAAAASEARGDARVEVITSFRAVQIARPAPGHRPAPKPDPGPIPEEMKAVGKLTGRKLGPSTLPPLTRSPRDTLPDLAGPVLSELEIHAIRVGEPAITAMVSGTDPQGAELLAKLRKVREDLGLQTATAAVEGPTPIGPPAPIPGVPVVDEQVVGVALSPAQRELFAGVVGQLLGETTAEAQWILTTIRQTHARYPRGVLQLFDPPLGQELVPGVANELTAAANGLRKALQIAPDQIDATIQARREEVVRLKQQAQDAQNGALVQAQTTAVKADARARGAAKATAQATVRAVAKDRAVAKPVDPTQARIERALAELREPIATELARLDTQMRLRERAIGDAIRAQVSAIGLAQTRDELALKPKRGEPETVESRLQAGEVGRWARKAIADLREGPESAQTKLVAEARAQTEQFKAELQAAATTAIAALQAWGASHAKATDGWWTALDANLQKWATDATARAELWESREGEASRLALAQDLESFQRIVALKQAGADEEVAQYMARLDGEGKAVVTTLIASINRGAPDLAGALTAGIRERVRAHDQAWIEDKLELLVDAIQPKFEDANYEALLRIAEALQPGWNLVERANKIHKAVTRYRGHDEEAIFAALGGLSTVAAKLLRIYYGHEWQPLEDALRGYGHVGHLNDDEMDTALQLLQGDRVQGAVGAINSAITGPGAAIGAVNDILRSLKPDERTRALALYEQRYGSALEDDLRDQWSLSRGQVDESMAIARNDLRGAEAAALGRSVSTLRLSGGGVGGGKRVAVIDRDKAAGVYAQIRREVEAEADRGIWSSDQIEAEITLRNHELEQRFDVEAKDQWWAKDQATGATRTAFALAHGPGRDLLEGLADNDMVKVDVAKIRLEDQGIYASDAALNAVFRDQNARSLAEVQRDLGPVLNARLDAQLAAEAGTFKTEEEHVNRRMALERENAQQITAVANTRTEERFDHLGAAYQSKSGRSLMAMVAANMSGTSREEAEARVRQHGVLSDYQKIRFSIEGLGTDMPQLRSTVAGMTKAELEAADVAWRRDHDGESLIEAIKDDTSGRDQGDLVDMAEHGVPETAAEVAAAARRKFDRDRAGDTDAGRLLTSDEIASAEHEVKRLEKQLAELRKTNQSAEARQRASMGFEIAIQHANSAIEAQRAALDSITDMLANAAAIITAVVVGALLSPFTGGASAVVAAAVIGSVVATGVSIGVKQLIKGAAYGREELYTDLAVGAVDALVAAATAGLGNALLGRAARGVTPVAKSSLFRALSQLGSIGRAAARGQARIAGTLGRFGTQGFLVRGLERYALLGGLNESKYLAVRLIGRGTAQLIEQGVQAVPSSFAASLMDERVYREPGGPLAVLENTFEGSVHSTAMGLGLHAAHHVGALGFHAGYRGVGTVVDRLRVAMPAEVRLPTGDVLGHIGTPRERLAEFRAWREVNPQGTVREFTSQLKAKAIERWALADPHPERTRAAREQLLADLPPHERGRYADVPMRSVPDAEFARLTGGAAGDAHLLVRDGQAVIVLRDGAPPSAARALLPEVRERVFAGSGGMTVEGALPKRLRDTPIRIDPTLPSDEIRVSPIPPFGGPITGVEVLVGPAARPIDVALHAGEVARIRRWTGRLGDARLALADFGARLGLEVVSPLDRPRFEAAGEVRKLGPIIEERIRRMVTAGDPRAAAAIERQALHHLAQLERARRILTGELVVEARGYVAQEGTLDEPTHAEGPADAPTAHAAAEPAAAPHPTSAEDEARIRGAQAVEALNALERPLQQLRRRVEAAEGRASQITAGVDRLEQLVVDRHGALESRGPLAWLSRFDAGYPEERARLIEELERRVPWQDPAERARARKAEAIANAKAGRPATSALKLIDLLHALQALRNAELAAPRLHAKAVENLAAVRGAYANAAAEVEHWVRQLVTKGAAGQKSPSGKRLQAGVELSDRLPAPKAPSDYIPTLLEGDSLAKQLKHLLGYHAELSMANRIADLLRQHVVEYGDRIGTNGADVTSVADDGSVKLWDSKNRGGGAESVESETFTEGSQRLADAIEQAWHAVKAREATGGFTEAMRAEALKNLEEGTFTAYTVTSKDATTFHTCVEHKFVKGKLVSPPREVAVPWGAGI